MTAINSRRISNTTPLAQFPTPDASPSTFRRKSSTGSALSSISTGSSVVARTPVTSATSPRVQLVPHTRTFSFDAHLSETERRVVDGTNFDRLDLSSQDFDFEDIFTYDKPQKKLAHVVEVSTPTRERDWSAFSFSHYPSAHATRNKVNRNRSGVVASGEKHLPGVKTSRAARKRPE